MPEDRTAVATPAAPQNDSPYSQAIVSGNLIFVSGQGPTDPETMELVGGDIASQTERTMRNVQAVLKAADASLDDIAKTTVYLADMDDYDAMNEAYSGFFNADPPARVCIEAARLPGGIDVEIEATARR
jgi:2-iminobutanoate/2-iminopropanoate deaminase